MLKLLADENFNGDIIRGILLREPAVDLARVQDVGLRHSTDPDILAWAAARALVVLTHDRKTMPRFAYDRVAKFEPMSGLVVVDDKLSIGLAIKEVSLIAICGEPADVESRVIFVPLSAKPRT